MAFTGNKLVSLLLKKYVGGSRTVTYKKKG